MVLSSSSYDCTLTKHHILYPRSLVVSVWSSALHDLSNKCYLWALYQTVFPLSYSSCKLNHRLPSTQYHPLVPTSWLVHWILFHSTSLFLMPHFKFTLLSPWNIWRYVHLGKSQEFLYFNYHVKYISPSEITHIFLVLSFLHFFEQQEVILSLTDCFFSLF